MAVQVIEATRGVAPREGWSYWKDTVLPSVDARQIDAHRPFEAWRGVTILGSGLVIDTASDPVSLERHARSRVEHAGVAVLLRGRGVVGRPGRAEAKFGVGDLAVYDLATPYRVAVLEPYRELRIHMPRDAFGARVGNIAALSGLVVPGGEPLARLFKGYLAGYADTLPDLSAHDAEIGLDGAIHLLANLLASRDRGRADGGEALSPEAVLALADRHVQALLGDPGLDVARLTRVTSLSRARLYRAFAGRGGVAAAIRDARLERARRQIASPAERHRTIDDIAQSCGFTDYPSFSRAFRRRFGAPPMAWRAR